MLNSEKQHLSVQAKQSILASFKTSTMYALNSFSLVAFLLGCRNHYKENNIAKIQLRTQNTSPISRSCFRTLFAFCHHTTQNIYCVDTVNTPCCCSLTSPLATRRFFFLNQINLSANSPSLSSKISSTAFLTPGYTRLK